MAVVIKQKEPQRVRILGIDPSTKTGWAMMETFGGGPVLLGGGRMFFPAAKGLERLEKFWAETINIINTWEPDMIVIEGYGYANAHTLVTLVEVGTAIRMAIHTFKEIPIIEVPPNSVKKFATGSGNAKKDKMLLEIYKRWGFEADTDDEVDAYALAMFGFALCDKVDLPKPNMEAVEKWKKSNEDVCNQLQKYLTN